MAISTIYEADASTHATALHRYEIFSYYNSLSLTTFRFKLCAMINNVHLSHFRTIFLTNFTSLHLVSKICTFFANFCQWNIKQENDFFFFFTFDESLMIYIFTAYQEKSSKFHASGRLALFIYFNAI